MIAKWEELGKPRYPYNEKTIIEILAARRFPK
jgi:hypothetical protein